MQLLFINKYSCRYSLNLFIIVSRPSNGGYVNSDTYPCLLDYNTMTTCTGRVTLTKQIYLNARTSVYYIYQ